jgi:hypothetical protein
MEGSRRARVGWVGVEVAHRHRRECTYIHETHTYTCMHKYTHKHIYASRICAPDLHAHTHTHIHTRRHAQKHIHTYRHAL